MTTQEAKALLRSARFDRQRLDALKLERERLMSAAVGGTARLDGTPHGGRDPREPGKLDALADMLTDIDTEAAQLWERVRTVRLAVSRVEEPYRTLLELRYVTCLTWEQVAEQMNYEVRTVYRLHEIALGKMP